MSTINEQNETRTMVISQEDTPRLALLINSLDSFQTGITGVCVQGVRDRQTDRQTIWKEAQGDSYIQLCL